MNKPVKKIKNMIEASTRLYQSDTTLNLSKMLLNTTLMQKPLTGYLMN